MVYYHYRVYLAFNTLFACSCRMPSSHEVLCGSLLALSCQMRSHGASQQKTASIGRLLVWQSFAFRIGSSQVEVSLKHRSESSLTRCRFVAVEIKIRRLKRWQRLMSSPQLHIQEIAVDVGHMRSESFNTVCDDGTLHVILFLFQLL